MQDYNIKYYKSMATVQKSKHKEKLDTHTQSINTIQTEMFVPDNLNVRTSKLTKLYLA